MFTNNCRDEVTLIFLKHKYQANQELIADESLSGDELVIAQVAELENAAILKTFAEVRDRNALGKQAGSYDAVAEQCDEFFKSIAAEPAQVG